MGRLSEYDKLDQARLRESQSFSYPASSPAEAIVGAPPSRLRFEDSEEKWQRFYADLLIALSEPEEVQ